MKTYQKILSFGCSFTEGNGLETSYYHRYLSSNLGNKNNLEFNLVLIKKHRAIRKKPK